MAIRRAKFVTDTATLCVFDLEALKHRLQDDCDWWSVPTEELQEENKGNVAFVGLGSDGQFTIILSDELTKSGENVSFLLSCPSGRVFIGAGEEVTGDGLEPEVIRGGAFVDVHPGTNLLLVRRISPNELALNLIPHSGRAKNSFVEPVRI